MHVALAPGHVDPGRREIECGLDHFGWLGQRRVDRGGVRVEVVSTSDASMPRVYDLAGHHVGDFEMQTGGGKTYWVWKATNKNGDVVAPGIYLVQSEVGGSTVTLKMGVVR